MFHNKTIRITVDDQLNGISVEKLRLLESLKQAQQGDTVKVDLSIFE